MKLELKSCKSDSNAMTVEVVDTDTGKVVVAGIGARTSGAPFLGHTASVKQLVGDLVDGINAFFLGVVPPDVVAPEEPEPKPAVSLRRSSAPKGAA